MMARVLVVDDQPDIRELLKSILSLRHYEVATAVGGVQALELLSCEAVPDLIVLDVQMPELDGWDTLSEIRRRYGTSGPAVVMCTVKGHPRDLLHGWTLGCDGYVWKPFDLKSFIDEIATVLSRDEKARSVVRKQAINEAEMLLRAV